MKQLKFLLLAVAIFSTTLYADSRADVEAFVERFYVTVLDRDSEQEGLDYWVNSLLSGEVAGADIARGFIFSSEFSNRATTDEAYLYILYRAFFNREPKAEGLSSWTNHLNNGKDRNFILDGFLYSTEFANLCEEYGIEPTEKNPIGDSRYTRNSNETVTDSTTGLIWQDNEAVADENNMKTWQEGIDYCNTLDFAGSTQWRLPDIYELVYISDRSKYAPTINSTFQNVSSNASYWSSTVYFYDSSKAWDISFYSADDSIYDKKYSVFIRCVRTGE